MKEFVNKLIGRLEEKENEAVLKAPNTSEIANVEYQKWMMKSYGFKESIEIVNELAEEHNGSWISCSERLPEEDGKYIVTVKNLTGRWIMKNNVFVCNYWDDDFHFQGWEDNEVIAWQPLPAPYKEGCE